MALQLPTEYAASAIEQTNAVFIIPQGRILRIIPHLSLRDIPDSDLNASGQS